jgi:hypothetical protein
MDPQATWNQMLEAYATSDWDEVTDLAEALIHWLGSGGFPPKVAGSVPVGDHWNRSVALYAAQLSLEDARRRKRS